MTKTTKSMFQTIATRGVIGAIPVAMLSAYATTPTPPRLAEYAIHQVAEITVSPTTVGIAASPLYGETQAQIDAQLTEMQALGVQNIRVFVPWALIEYPGPTSPTDPATSAYWSQLNLVMQSAAAHNMGVLAEINSTPPYAVTAGTAGSGTPNPAAFAAFMTKFVTRYGSTVSAYEIWNEPNFIQFSNPIDPAAYAALVKAAYTAIKPLDPTATVIAGAVGHVFTTGITTDPVEYVQAMIAADPTIGNYFDALSYHPYDETLPFSQGNVNPNSGGFASDTAYNQVKDLMALFPTKKVWISEFGVPTYSYHYVDGNGVTQTVTVTQQQQDALIKDLVTTWSTLSQAGPIFLYTGRDTATGSADPNANFGLWDQQGTPKLVITDFLKQYFLTYPQNPTAPITPPTPVDPFAAALQAFAQQVAQSIANAVAQAFAQTLGQQIANAVVTAISRALAGLGQPQPVTPAISTMAPVAAPAARSITTMATTVAAPSTPTPIAALTATTTPKVTPVATPVAAAAVMKTPEASTPASATPASTTPPSTTPVAATAAATQSTTDTSTSTYGKSAATYGKSAAESPSATGHGDTGQGSATKPGSSDKTTADKSSAPTSGPSPNYEKGKRDNGTSAAVQPTTGTDTNGAGTAGATGSTESTGTAGAHSASS